MTNAGVLLLVFTWCVVTKCVGALQCDSGSVSSICYLNSFYILENEVNYFTGNSLVVESTANISCTIPQCSLHINLTESLVIHGSISANNLKINTPDLIIADTGIIENKGLINAERVSINSTNNFTSYGNIVTSGLLLTQVETPKFLYNIYDNTTNNNKHCGEFYLKFPFFFMWIIPTFVLVVIFIGFLSFCCWNRRRFKYQKIPEEEHNSVNSIERSPILHPQIETRPRARSLQLTQDLQYHQQQIEEIEKEIEKEKETEKENESASVLFEKYSILVLQLQRCSEMIQEIENSELCLNCENQRKSIALIPCGHVVYCNDCCSSLFPHFPSISSQSLSLSSSLAAPGGAIAISPSLPSPSLSNFCPVCEQAVHRTFGPIYF